LVVELDTIELYLPLNELKQLQERLTACGAPQAAKDLFSSRSSPLYGHLYRLWLSDKHSQAAASGMKSMMEITNSRFVMTKLITPLDIAATAVFKHRRYIPRHLITKYHDEILHYIDVGVLDGYLRDTPYHRSGVMGADRMRRHKEQVDVQVWCIGRLARNVCVRRQLTARNVLDELEMTSRGQSHSTAVGEQSPTTS
jgi:hypothetical protein